MFWSSLRSSQHCSYNTSQHGITYIIRNTDVITINLYNYLIIRVIKNRDRSLSATKSKEDFGIREH